MRVCPQAFFFEHKNTKTHLSRPKKGIFSCFDVQAKSRWGGLHIKKTQFLPAFRRFCRSEASPLEASCPILLLLTMEALPNSPLAMEGLIPAGAPTHDMDGTLALPTLQATCMTSSAAGSGGIGNSGSSGSISRNRLAA